MPMTPVQRDLLAGLGTADPELSHAFDERRGVLSFVRGSDLAHAVAAPGARGSDDELIAAFLDANDQLFGPAGLRQQLRPLAQQGDDLGFTHYTFQQMSPGKRGRGGSAHGVEIYGAKLAVHIAPGQRLVEVQSSCEVQLGPANDVKVEAAALQKSALGAIRRLAGFARLEEEMRARKEPLFPLMQPPRLVLYPWKDKLVYAWATYGYGRLPKEEQERPETAKDSIAFGQMFFDAGTGQLFLFAPTRKGVETPDTGSGLGVTPLGGPYSSRSLEIVHVDSGSTYRLKNTTKARDIVTYDANANTTWVYPAIPQHIANGDIPVSDDTDGDKNWNLTAASTSDADRTASQQPEVDAHHTVADIYDWYYALAGRIGWDNGQYSAPLVPNQALNVVTHTYDTSVGTSRSVNAFFDQELVSGSWVSHLAFFDGDPTGATIPGLMYDYLAGSRAIIGHEYRHAVTDFSFVDGAGNPGLTYTDWLAAVHEGTSDVFGGLFARQWWMGTEVSPTGQIFRNLAFPRDTAAADPSKFDHWDDRNNITGTAARYYRGDILANAAYLMAQGGIHQRAVRTPALIPVRGLGDETLGGQSIYAAARIIYRAYAHYVSNIGASTGLPSNDESVYRTIRNACVSAAIDLYGTGSIQHLTTILAWYAVGLQPPGTAYGADVTFVTWGADWWMSRPYVGISSPDWSSRDLFINNGGASEWNAKINVIDGGVPTQYENHVYCRVRNVGDQLAHNVQVQFEYTKITSGGASWLPMVDKNGNVQTLSVGDLAAGAMNFPDAAQDTPPSTAMVKWWIPPLAPGETVDHFCMRARVSSIDDVNPHNNEVQSNVAYVPYVPGTGLRIGFMVGNDGRERLPVELQVTHTLPAGWGLKLIEQTRGLVLAPGESRRVHALVEIPDGRGSVLEAPFDGRIKGAVGKYGGYTGVLTQGRLDGAAFTACVAMLCADGAHLSGALKGHLDLATARFNGTLTGAVQDRTGTNPLDVHIEGCLRPDRVINIGQFAGTRPIGGLSIQVQMPLPHGSCFEELPPTSTKVSAAPTHRHRLKSARELLDSLDLDDAEVCDVDVRSVLLELTFKRRNSC